MTDSRIQRLVAEVLFPLIGVFAWDWSFDFICWFYAIDVFLNALVGMLRHRNHRDVLGLVLPWFELILVFTLLVLSGNGIWISFKNFLAYEDMGLAQGYILIPLILLNEWLRWKLEQRTRLLVFTSNNAHLYKICGFALTGVLLPFVHDLFMVSLIFLGVLTAVNLMSKPIITTK
ncbi:MAG: hypothetical protein ACKO4Y_08150 [Flavobacteriales bacterium]